MITVFDTSSLLAFVRYYLPFDLNKKLFNLLKEKFEVGEIIIIDKVIDECKYQANGLILKELDFLNNKKIVVDTTEILPPPKFFNLLENQFCDKKILKLKDIDNIGYEIEKKKYLNSADPHLILFSLYNKDKFPIIITEETSTSNDNKIFKKIPTCCNLVSIECISLPNLFLNKFNINLFQFIE